MCLKVNAEEVLLEEKDCGEDAIEKGFCRRHAHCMRRAQLRLRALSRHTARDARQTPLGCRARSAHCSVVTGDLVSLPGGSERRDERPLLAGAAAKQWCAGVLAVANAREVKHAFDHNLLPCLWLNNNTSVFINSIHCTFSFVERVIRPEQVAQLYVVVTRNRNSSRIPSSLSIAIWRSLLVHIQRN